MCTNYVPTRGDRLQEFFNATMPSAPIREEAYPGYLAPIIKSLSPHDDSGRFSETVAACFGLIPSWSRDGKNYRFCYNARSETVAEKPSFRTAWRKRQRCIIPVDAFFEPNYESGRAVRWRISSADDRPLALAGIWEAWRLPENVPRNQLGKRGQPGPPEIDPAETDWLISFSMLTINADHHPLMNRFHAPGDEKRSVVMLNPDEAMQWLDAPESQVTDLFGAYPPEQLKTSPAPKKEQSRRQAKTTPAPIKAQPKLL
ncbi:MAG: SOS response-associated peptidase [Burkholderiaceae bacterium]